MNNNFVKELLNALGAVAELSLSFTGLHSMLVQLKKKPLCCCGRSFLSSFKATRGRKAMYEESMCSRLP